MNRMMLNPSAAMPFGVSRFQSVSLLQRKECVCPCVFLRALNTVSQTQLCYILQELIVCIQKLCVTSKGGFLRKFDAYRSKACVNDQTFKHQNEEILVAVGVPDGLV